MSSEKEKMLAGEYYDARDAQLQQERVHARALCFEYNQTPPTDAARRQEIMTQGSFHIESTFYCDYGYNIEVGNGFYANFGCVILDVNKVTIGESVLLAPNVQLYTATHPIDPAERLNGKEYAKPITIGDNVWIGGGAIICPGVTVGDHAVIGAGSVVTKDIPARVIAVGNPCRVLREIQ